MNILNKAFKGVTFSIGGVIVLILSVVILVPLALIGYLAGNALIGIIFVVFFGWGMYEWATGKLDK